MRIGPVRPRFHFTLPDPDGAAIRRLQDAVRAVDDELVARTLGDHVDITVAPARRHRWSPCIHLEFQPNGETTVVDGLVGPHPNVWTMFAFTNLSLAVVASFGLVLALSQVTLGWTAWGLWITVACVILMGGMYVVSQVGRRLAEPQTRTLVDLVERTFDVDLR